MSTESDLRRRIAELEYRLDQYHEYLEEALEYDRRFQMQATWGIVTTLAGMSAFFAVLYITEQDLHFEGWAPGTIAGCAALAAWVVVAGWADKGRQSDLKKLSRLPQWERPCDHQA